MRLYIFQIELQFFSPMNVLPTFTCDICHKTHVLKAFSRRKTKIDQLSYL